MQRLTRVRVFVIWFGLGLDDCSSMLSKIHSPSIVGMASSSRTEDSYSVDVSSDLG